MAGGAFWSAARIDRLKELVVQGVSYRVIADELGVTRNAAIGRARRDGLCQKHKPKPTIVHEYKRGSYAERKAREERFALGGQRLQPGPRYLLTDPKYRKRVVGSIITFELARERVYTGNDWDIPVEQRRTLLTLGEHECHWPIGDPRSPEFFFCGAEQIEDTRIPYCAHHARIAYAGA